MVLCRKDVNAMEENLNKENKVRKDYTIEDYTIGDATFVIEKPIKPIKAQNGKFLLEKTVRRYCAWIHRIYDRANQGNHEWNCGYGKK